MNSSEKCRNVMLERRWGPIPTSKRDSHNRLDILVYSETDEFPVHELKVG